jgi:hypothetical protein
LIGDEVGERGAHEHAAGAPDVVVIEEEHEQAHIVARHLDLLVLKVVVDRVGRALGLAQVTL